VRNDELEEVLMAIVGGFDVHRAQITFDYVDTESGELSRGQIRPASRQPLREWLAERFEGRDDVAFAFEGCTGWRFIAEELLRVGVEPHLAEPADTAAQRGRKKHAKTDRGDAKLLRELLAQRRLPESWIAPEPVLEMRTLGRLYAALMAHRRAWQQRIHAQLYHQGVPPIRRLLTAEGRAALEVAALSPAGRQVVASALTTIDLLTMQIEPLRSELQRWGRRHPGARALMRHYGIGALCAAIIWAELGDCRRFARSDQAVRFTGLDISVWSSDSKRSPGRLTRQGSPALRWALFEAAKAAARSASPDHAYYVHVRDRLGSKRATLSVARKLTRRCHHTLRALGDEAWLPLAPSPMSAVISAA
jgi:transposase